MRTNSFATICLVAFLIWVPIPLGSNRPIFWTVNAGIASVIFVAAFLGARDHFFTDGRRTLVLISASAILVVAWFLVQAAAWTPQGIHHPVWEEFGLGSVGAISANPSATYTASVEFLAIILVGIVAARLSFTPQGSISIVWAVASSATLVAVWGLVSLALNWPSTILGEIENREYLTGFFANSNSAATFIGMGLVAALSILVTRIQSAGVGRDRYLALIPYPSRAGIPVILVMILMVALVASGSRAGTLAGLFGAITVFAISWRNASWRPVLGLAILMVVAGIVIAAGGFQELFDRFVTVDLATDERWDVYRDTIAAIADRPLLGHGAGTFADIFPLYHGLETSGQKIWLAAHSTYLQAAAELGLPAFAAVFCLLAFAVARCARAARLRPEPATIAAVGAAAVVGAHALFDFSLQVQAIAIGFAALLGCGTMAASRRLARDRRSRKLRG